jgi:hypothetical protein
MIASCFIEDDIEHLKRCFYSAALRIFQARLKYLYHI